METDYHAAWKTLQHAADKVHAGDTVTVLPGTYAGFNLFTSGTPDAPITFTANQSSGAPNPAVIVNSNNGFTNKDRINLEGASQMIDILTLLDQKTKGNLTAEERSVLEQVLYELRLRFVEVSSGRKLIIEP